MADQSRMPESDFLGLRSEVTYRARNGSEAPMLVFLEARRARDTEAVLEREIASLRSSLREALELAEDAIAYVPECFRDKWKMPEQLAALKAKVGRV